MTQQLTREQLKFARSIGAVYCISAHIGEHDRLECGELGKPGFVYRHGWVEWKHRDNGVSDTVSLPEKRFEIDFSPLDEPEPEYVPTVGEWCLSSGGAKLFYVGEASNGGGVFQLESGGITCIDNIDGFRPLPDPEQQRRDELLEKWQSRSLDNARDTEASVLTVGDMIGFIIDLEGE